MTLSLKNIKQTNFTGLTKFLQLSQLNLVKQVLKSATYLAVFFGAFQVTASHADSSIAKHLLDISPKQCVAVRQGQDCYLDIKIVWQTQATGNYCLYSSQQEQPLQCWQQVNKVLFEKEWVSNENIIFSIKKQMSNDVLASGKLTMAWVYKKSARSHSSWRMF